MLGTQLHRQRKQANLDSMIGATQRSLPQMGETVLNTFMSALQDWDAHHNNEHSVFGALCIVLRACVQSLGAVELVNDTYVFWRRFYLAPFHWQHGLSFRQCLQIWESNMLHTRWGSAGKESYRKTMEAYGFVLLCATPRISVTVWGIMKQVVTVWKIFGDTYVRRRR